MEGAQGLEHLWDSVCWCLLGCSSECKKERTGKAWEKFLSTSHQPVEVGGPFLRGKEPEACDSWGSGEQLGSLHSVWCGKGQCHLSQQCGQLGAGTLGATWTLTELGLFPLLRCRVMADLGM